MRDVTLFCLRQADGVADIGDSHIHDTQYHIYWTFTKETYGVFGIKKTTVFLYKDNVIAR